MLFCKKYKGGNVAPALACSKHIFNRNDKSEHTTHLDNVVRIIIVWSECNYRIWKNQVISMVLAQQVRGIYPKFEKKSRCSKDGFEQRFPQIYERWSTVLTDLPIPSVTCPRNRASEVRSICITLVRYSHYYVLQLRNACFQLDLIICHF